MTPALAYFRGAASTGASNAMTSGVGIRGGVPREPAYSYESRETRAGRRDYSTAMSKFVIAMIVVAALLISGLVRLLRNSRMPMGSPEALERAKQRNRELEEQERRENER